MYKALVNASCKYTGPIGLSFETLLHALAKALSHTPQQKTSIKKMVDIAPADRDASIIEKYLDIGDLPEKVAKKRLHSRLWHQEFQRCLAMTMPKEMSKQKASECAKAGLQRWQEKRKGKG